MRTLKLKDNNYWYTYSIMHSKKSLKTYLNNNVEYDEIPIDNSTVNTKDIFNLTGSYTDYNLLLIIARTNYNNYVDVWCTVEASEYWHNLNIYETDSYGAIGRFALQNNNQLYLITTKSSGTYLVIDKIIGFKF